VCDLADLYRHEGRLETEINLVDILDDLACLGVPGSSTEYLRRVQRRRKTLSREK